MDGKLRPMTAVYILQGEKILLLYRVGSRVVAPSFCGVGGHFEEGELCDARACVLREMHEELDLTEEDVGEISFRYITLRDTKGEIRQNYYFFAELKTDRTLSSNEGTLRWVTAEEALNLPMPVTAKGVVEHYIRIGQFDRKRYVGATGENGTAFMELPVT